jgi:hypothetical protein
VLQGRVVLQNRVVPQGPGIVTLQGLVRMFASCAMKLSSDCAI